jgi:ABC-type uncharacterized transport system substrate-binding protein
MANAACSRRHADLTGGFHAFTVWCTCAVRGGGLWEKMARAHIDRIFKGEKPGDLPLIALDDFELVVNLKTAARLGLAVPDKIRRSATKLVE